MLEGVRQGRRGGGGGGPPGGRGARGLSTNNGRREGKVLRPSGRDAQSEFQNSQSFRERERKTRFQQKFTQKRSKEAVKKK